MNFCGMGGSYRAVSLRIRAWLVATALCVLTAWYAQGAPRVQVRGTSRIELHAWGPANRITISGTVRDEVGAPVVRCTVALVALAAPDVTIAWESIHTCGQPAPTVFSEHTEHQIQTDDTGSFCVLAAMSRPNASLRATFGGDVLHEPTRSEIVWSAAQKAMELELSPRPERIDLDAARWRVSARITVPPDVRAAGALIVLGDERGQQLASVLTDDVGLARFDLPTVKLDGPGFGTLRVRFAGNDDLPAAEAEARVTRTARVRLETDRGTVRGDPNTGISIRVRATTSRGRLEDGFVEAMAGSERVGLAPVRAGFADVLASFARPRADRTAVQLRFVSDAPFYVSGEPIEVTVETIRSTAFARFVPLLVAVGVAVWLIRGWRRPKRREKPRTRQTVAPAGVASIEVLGASAEGRAWKGAVLDAHDGTPIAHARVRVIAPSFVDLDVVTETATDDEGTFAFEVPGSTREFLLRVQAPLHVELEKPLPRPSEMVISLVSRRRMLLQRLVEWARRVGKPWDASPEPTPGHVARAAGRHLRRADVAAWADAVEQRAYGPEPVDARAEREVKTLEPPGHGAR
jgi:hypothetical protein